ncbi:right-handed parallel beta-helix repeat-containing protein [Myxococcota bacterium]
MAALLAVAFQGCSEGSVDPADGGDADDAGWDAGDPGGDPGGSDDAGEDDAGGTDESGADEGPITGIYVDSQIGPSDCATYDPASRSCSGGSEQAYKTLAGAAAVAGPGETVLIREGTYSEALIPQISGEPGRPVTWRNYGTETVTISNASLSPAVDISGRSCLVIEGLVVTDVRRWLHALDSHHNIIRDNTFRRALDSGGSSKTGIFLQEATFNRVLDNTIEDSTQDNLSLIKSDRNLVAGNTFRMAAHTLWTIKCGNFNVLRDNYFHNQVQKIGEVYDCDAVGFDHEFTFFDATKHNLVEGNEFAYTASSGDSSPYSGIQYAGQQGIVRFNRFYETVGPALQMTLYSDEARYNTDNRVYHNVFYKTDFAGIEISGSSYTFSGNVFINNILSQSIFVANDTRWTWYTSDLAGEPVQLKTGRLDGFIFDTNCFYNTQPDEDHLITHGNRNSGYDTPPHTVTWWQTNHPAVFINCREADPVFENAAAYDFRLKPASTLINAGRFLTQTTAAGSGTSLPVEDASFFYDGYQIPGETGDQIQLEGQITTARVVSIDYNSNTLVLDTPLDWTDNQGVSLRYNGSAPDVGAHENP